MRKNLTSPLARELTEAGLSVRRFCVLWGIPPSTMYRWTCMRNSTRAPGWVIRAIRLVKYDPYARRLLSSPDSLILCGLAETPDETLAARRDFLPDREDVDSRAAG